MSEARQGESRHDDVVHRNREVFGPSADLLVRELSRRLPLERRDAFLKLIENWPFAEDGKPRDPDLLFARLVELLESLGPTPAPSPGRRRRRRRRRRRGSNMGGLLGLALGALTGLPVGFLAFLVARETVMPIAWREEDNTIWVFLFAVCLPAALLGMVQGSSPSRLGHALAVGLVGFLLGCLAAGTIAALGVVIGVEVLGRGEDEAALALDVGFGLVPLAAALGGGAVGLFMGRSAWLRWSSWGGGA
jgi:hypothetical protein